MDLKSLLKSCPGSRPVSSWTKPLHPSGNRRLGITSMRQRGRQDGHPDGRVQGRASEQRGKAAPAPWFKSRPEHAISISGAGESLSTRLRSQFKYFFYLGATTGLLPDQHNNVSVVIGQTRNLRVSSTQRGCSRYPGACRVANSFVPKILYCRNMLPVPGPSASHLSEAVTS